MAVQFANTVAVRILRATTVPDRYGNLVPSGWVPVADVCSVAPLAPRQRAPGQRAELIEAGRSGVVVGVTAYLPYGTDIRPHDRVEIAGQVFDVDGEPGVWEWPTAGGAGVEVVLKRVDG